MQHGDFRQFLGQMNNKLSRKSDPDKIRVFLDWCKKRRIEELILRLASETKGGWGSNCTLDFTTRRLIVKKKSFFKKFADLGYVAGLAPYPYLVVKKNKKLSDIRAKTTIDSEYMKDNVSTYIWYDEIHECILRKGIDRTVTNMMGRAIVMNYLTIKTKNVSYDFTLPVNKNGKFDEIHCWLNVILPLETTMR